MINKSMKLFSGARNISGNPSIMLDSLRIIAALTVYLGHAYDQWNYHLGGHIYSTIDNIGHSSVVVFFVLSGYVIAHTTTNNNRGKLKYAQARLSRLYSVVFPALILTAVAEFALRYGNSDLSAHYTRGTSWPRYITSGLFVNEIWFFSSAPPINGPLWSLSFEFWYYVVFGFWFFKGKGALSFVLPLVVCLIAGPKILLMMPIWIFGNIAYRLKRPQVSANISWLSVFTLLIVASFLVFNLPFLPNQVGTSPLFFAAQFVTDWIIGVFIAAALWLLPTTSFDTSSRKSVEVSPWRNTFRKCADLTFPLYVMHDPLLIVWRSIFPPNGLHDYKNMLLAIVVVLLVCVVIGSFLENRRGWWVNLFKIITLKVQQLIN